MLLLIFVDLSSTIILFNSFQESIIIFSGAFVKPTSSSSSYFVRLNSFTPRGGGNAPLSCFCHQLTKKKKKKRDERFLLYVMC